MLPNFVAVLMVLPEASRRVVMLPLVVSVLMVLPEASRRVVMEPLVVSVLMVLPEASRRVVMEPASTQAVLQKRRMAMSSLTNMIESFLLPVKNTSIHHDNI